MNCKVELKSAVSSKTNKPYYYLLFTINNREISRQFIKETEVLYYQELLK